MWVRKDSAPLSYRNCISFFLCRANSGTSEDQGYSNALSSLLWAASALPLNTYLKCPVPILAVEFWGFPWGTLSWMVLPSIETYLSYVPILSEPWKDRGLTIEDSYKLGAGPDFSQVVPLLWWKHSQNSVGSGCALSYWASSAQRRHRIPSTVAEPTKEIRGRQGGQRSSEHLGVCNATTSLGGDSDPRQGLMWILE